MSEYLCKNCNYKTQYFLNMKTHLSKTQLCDSKLNIYYGNYTMDQKLILSLVPHNKDGIQIITKDEMFDYNNKYIDNRRKLINRISENCNKKCYYCNETFNRNMDLRKHILLECFYKNMVEEDNKRCGNIINSQTNNITNNNITNNNNNITNNTNNNTINNNITNNIVINVDKSLVSFDKSWDLSEIKTVGEKLEILCSDILYTNLLSKLLENKKNLNVILDKKSKQGYVYDAETEKFINMAANDILQMSMKKLRDNLLQINNSISNYTVDGGHQQYKELTEKLDTERNIRNKYTYYNEDLKKRNHANYHLLNIYDDNKKKASDLALELELNISSDILCRDEKL